MRNGGTAILAAKYPPPAAALEWKRSFVVLISLMDPRDYPTIILFVRWALNERKPKAETGASAKIERGEASAPRSLGGRRL